MIKKILGMTIALILLPAAFADEVSEDVRKTILDKLQETRSDLEYGAVEASPIDGLYRVRINGTQFFYANRTGDYIITGDMYQTRPGMFVPVKDLAAAKLRKEMLGTVATKDMIVFPAVDTRRYVLHVFTDVDCGYCRKLHVEAVPELNMAGVEVRYLAFPRAGLDSGSYRKVASAWCAKDKLAALTALKNREPIKENVCVDNPVASHYELGQKIGISGTPALILEDGALLPGYSPASELLTIMGLDDGSDG
ncbi:DsbC family protein [Porticoccus sp.]|uniref:DsbC family protein n=1 Tax=Porticoccus sp. TaxID=2024853 RepID=UPI003F695AEE